MFGETAGLTNSIKSMRGDLNKDVTGPDVGGLEYHARWAVSREERSSGRGPQIRACRRKRLGLFGGRPGSPRPICSLPHARSLS